ncbi:dephospho-CoA kinase [Caldimonas sp. KR1-144]|uniref:dephospho-CoA kinase n=1 Tax=Caldimonas sp. KR1-144 TaxID=3400911 RepID=UPI003C0D4ABF
MRLTRIGLTGGIGSGKSTVAARWQALGAHVVDTDAIARALTAPHGAAIDALRHEFGAEAIGADGALDRERMRQLAFTDRSARRRLEAVLHPLIGIEAQAQARQTGPGQPVLFDVPLLVESQHWRARVQRVLLVDCPQALQIERVVRRSGWLPEAVQRVIEQQAPRERRRAAADAVIDNSHDDLARLHADVDRLWALWCSG